jgi:L-asparaginase II
MTGATLGDDVCGTDGCSIPTYAAPLLGIAQGFAKLGTGYGLEPKRAEAARRIFKAVAAHPFMVAGTGRFDTDAMNILRERVFMKTGAEGVYCASFPELGYGIALKIDDGATRASQAVMEALIAKFLPLDDETKAKLRALGEPHLKNWNKIEVGTVRAVV